MSKSSRTLKEEELPLLREAQRQAVVLGNYGAWLAYMRSTHIYARVVRMSLFMGCKVPSRKLYELMLEEGKQLLDKEGKSGGIPRSGGQACGSRAGVSGSGVRSRSARVQAAPLTPRKYC